MERIGTQSCGSCSSKVLIVKKDSSSGPFISRFTHKENMCTRRSIQAMKLQSFTCSLQQLQELQQPWSQIPSGLPKPEWYVSKSLTGKATPIKTATVTTKV